MAGRVILIGIPMKLLSFLIMAMAALTPQLARADSNDRKTFHSADGKYQLELSRDWESADFHINTVLIGAANKHSGEYVELVAENIQDYTDSLDQYAEAKRDTMAMSLDNPRLKPGERLEINGLHALRFEIHGTLPNSNVSVGYVLTVMKTKSHYVQIIGWTLEKHFADDLNDLQNLAAGFSETAPADQK